VDEWVPQKEISKGGNEYCILDGKVQAAVLLLVERDAREDGIDLGEWSTLNGALFRPCCREGTVLEVEAAGLHDGKAATILHLPQREQKEAVAEEEDRGGVDHSDHLPTEK